MAASGLPTGASPSPSLQDGSMRREIDTQAEKRERDSFVLLQHLYTVAEADTAETFSGRRLGAELGFADGETRELLDHLVWAGCISCHGEEPLLSITPAGIDYIERLAWRRHSVRRN